MRHILIKNATLKSVRVSDKTEWRHLLLEAEGHVGLGEFTVDGVGAELDSEAAAMAASMVGRSLDVNVEKEFAALCRRDMRSAAIISAIDQAVHDLRARICGLPLAEYLGARQIDRPVLLYANINRRTINRTPAGFQASAELARGEGFSAIKIAPFDGLAPGLCGTREGDVLLGEALERMAAVRDRLPRSIPIFVDCHWRLTSQTSLKILPELSKLGVSWFECPLPENRSTIREIATLRRKANDFGIRLAGCETMTTLDDFRPYLEAGAYDVIMPDVKYVGGFGALREVATCAEQNKVAVSLHNPTGPICHLHSLHACVALGLTEPLEIQFGETTLFEAIVHPAIPAAIGGESRLPSGAGLGASLIDHPAMKTLSLGSSTKLTAVHN